MSGSFYMSNMSPQVGDFNRGIWSKLEATVRNFADTEGAVYVVTGPVLTDGPYKTIGKNKVSVPNAYYKVVLDYQEPEYKAIGFVLPNEGSKKDLQTFTTSIDEVEELTGLDFFHRLKDTEENELEASFDVSQWDSPPSVQAQRTARRSRQETYQPRCRTSHREYTPLQKVRCRPSSTS
jgi:endonuclease G